MKIYDFYIYKILIHIYPNLLVKLEKIGPKMSLKNNVIFGENIRLLVLSNIKYLNIRTLGGM